MLGLSFAAVPLYDMFCRVTGFGGTTQVSKEAPDIVLDKVVSVRFDTNVNNLTWDFKAKSNVIDVKVGQVTKLSLRFKITVMKPLMEQLVLMFRHQALENIIVNWVVFALKSKNLKLEKKQLML